MGLDRRSFISLVTGGVVGSLFTPVVWKTLDDVSIWTQNWPWIPTLNYGEELSVPALCKLGSDAYGIKIKTVAGKPVVATGNPDHPLSLGGICPLGAASVQLLYSPSRIKNPKVKDGDKFKDISWEEAEGILAEKLKSAGSDVAMISGDETGSVTDVLAGVVGKLGSDKSFFMPSESAPASAALAMLGGDGQVGYDIENASYVLMLGADRCWLLGQCGPQRQGIFRQPRERREVRLCRACPERDHGRCRFLDSLCGGHRTGPGFGAGLGDHQIRT
jgi:Anaerobic dehydrogenases, typically selenocysteine-containing